MLLFFICIIIILFFCLFFVELKLIIDELKMECINFKYIIKLKYRIGIYFLGKIKIYEKKYNKDINNTQNKKINNKNNENNKNKENKENKVKKYNKVLNRIKIQTLNLDVNVGTKNEIITAYVVGIVVSIVSVILGIAGKQKYKKNYIYSVNGLYNNENEVYIKLNSIINLKIVNIISILKRGGKKWENIQLKV